MKGEKKQQTLKVNILSDPQTFKEAGSLYSLSRGTFLYVTYKISGKIQKQTLTVLEIWHLKLQNVW